MKNTNKQNTILIVDDTPENIDLLDGILNQDYKVLAAVNGVSALKIANTKKPDLILLDVMMPEMDGYEVCKKLKENLETKKIPVIFVTARAEPESEIKGFSIGAVDYITKPISPPIVKSRVATHLKIKNLINEIEHKKEVVENANKQMLNEQHIAKSIYDNMVEKGCLDEKNIKHILWPMDVFAGDLLLASVGINDNFYLLLGDFTGHGLAASIGVMPTTEIFYAMSKKGFALSTIMKEINKKLNKSLPVGMFCAACAIEIDKKNKLLSLWNGWNPDVLLVDKTGNLRMQFKSNHMPLGLQKEEKFDSGVEMIFLNDDDRLYIYSDGITEAKGEDSGMFGVEGVINVFKNCKDPNMYFEEILDALKKYRGKISQMDDITMVEYHNFVEHKDKDKDKNKDKDKKI